MDERKDKESDMEENKKTEEEKKIDVEEKTEETGNAKTFTEHMNDAVDKMVEKAKPYVEKAKPAVKKATKKVQEKAKPAVKAAKKKAKQVKTAVDNKLYEHEVIVQFAGNSYYAKDANEKSIEDYVANGGKREQIKQVQLYIKPDERACYYVINNKTTGRVDL